MPLPERFVNDIYDGLIGDVKRNPWLSIAIGSLWTAAWLVFIFVYPTLAQTSEVQRTDMKVDIVLRVVLEGKLKELVRVQCDGPPSSWWPVEGQITAQKEEYEAFTRRKWRKMSCEEARK